MTKPFDRILTIDFETRWDKKDYTLSKMTTEEYIRDKRFQAFGACVHEFGTDAPIEWVGGDGLREYFSGINWGRTAVLAHNAQFDVSTTVLIMVSFLTMVLGTNLVMYFVCAGSSTYCVSIFIDSNVRLLASEELVVVAKRIQAYTKAVNV